MAAESLDRLGRIASADMPAREVSDVLAPALEPQWPRWCPRVRHATGYQGQRVGIDLDAAESRWMSVRSPDGTSASVRVGESIRPALLLTLTER